MSWSKSSSNGIFSLESESSELKVLREPSSINQSWPVMWQPVGWQGTFHRRSYSSIHVTIGRSPRRQWHDVKQDWRTCMYILTLYISVTCDFSGNTILKRYPFCGFLYIYKYIFFIYINSPCGSPHKYCFGLKWYLYYFLNVIFYASLKFYPWVLNAFASEKCRFEQRRFSNKFWLRDASNTCMGCLVLVVFNVILW